MSNRDIASRIPYASSDPLLEWEKVEFIVVDDGSDPVQQCRHESACKVCGARYLSLPTAHLNVNMARARNAGVKEARGRYVVFMDVDLHPYPGFYDDLLREIEVQRLDMHPNDLIMVSVLYLTREEGNGLFFETGDSLRRALFIQKYLENDRKIIEKFSSGTSVTLFRRDRYFELGGYDEAYEQWGYEDIDFNLRLIGGSNQFARPEAFEKDIGDLHDAKGYRGWKSLYRLYGRLTWQKGMVLFHMGHEVDHQSQYIAGYEKNRQYFAQKLKKLGREKRLQKPRITFDSPLFDPLCPVRSGRGVYTYYKNSRWIVWMQKLKSIPLLGPLLRAFKQKVLGWK